MRIVCVDDERLSLKIAIEECRRIVGDQGEALGFTSSAETLAWFRENTAEVALLDINMPDMNGLVLAAHIKELSPDTAIVFLTAYPEYAVEAFAIHVSGYVLKPPEPGRLRAEIEYAMAIRSVAPLQKPAAPFAASTFGNFDLLVHGKPVAFRRSKAKELLAYLIDRRGSNITRPEAAAILWEDTDYDRSMQKQLDVIIRSLRQTLEDCGLKDLMEIRSGFMRIRPEMIDCDLYLFMDGDAAAVNAYRGEYMNSYSWAELTAAYMDRLQNRL